MARSHWSGLYAAQLAATEWASGGVDGVDLLGLVIIADAPGKRPRPLKELAGLVAGAVPRTWFLPWVEAWRVGEEVTEATASREVRRVLTDVQTLIPTPTHAPVGPYRER